MAQYRFRISGVLPPKKDGSNSLWRKETELPRVIHLRQAAAAEIGDRPALTRDVRLTLLVHVPAGLGRRAGDLDNYVTGVLDGLQAASGSDWKKHPTWAAPDALPISPDRCIGLVDDAAVIEIVARKFEDADPPWYEVVLEGSP